MSILNYYIEIQLQYGPVYIKRSLFERIIY